MLNRIRNWLCPDLAIDLGTTNTLVAVSGQGVVVDEPSVVALQNGTRRVLGRGTAVGKLARQMLGRTPDSITAVRPIQHGVIADFELCESMLRYFIRKAVPRTHGFRPRVVLSVPGHVSRVEKRAVFNSAERAGAGQVFLIREAKSAAVGSGLPIAEPLASLICNIGGGTTDVAVFSLADIVASRSLRIGGDDFDDAIAQYLKERLSLRIGLQQAEQIKMEIGSAAPLDRELTTEVRGRDIVSGVPRKAIVTSEEIREALQRPLGSIVFGIKSAIEDCEPELVGDLVDNGLVLAGGGALLRGMDVFLSEQLNVPARVDADPLTTVARGAAICLEHLAEWRDSLESAEDV